MLRSSISIASYKVDEAPGVGKYPTHSSLEEKMKEVLQIISEKTAIEAAVPNIPGATVSGSAIGNGLCLSASINAQGTGIAPHVSTWLALDQDSANTACNEALLKAKEYGFPQHYLHPEWLQAMKEVPPPPFTIVLPNLDAVRVISKSISDTKDFQLLTGFIQTLIGQALTDAGVESLPAADVEQIEKERLDHAMLMAAAAQTKGELPDQLIVRPGYDGYPEVYAHIMDVEMDVFTVLFQSDDTMTINTESLSYLMLESAMLAQIIILQEKASEVWAEALQIIDEEGAPEGQYIGTQRDPLRHLYTHNDKVEVPPGLAESLRGLVNVQTD